MAQRQLNYVCKKIAYFYLENTVGMWMCRSNIYENNVVYNPTAVSKSPFFSVFVFLLLAVFFLFCFSFLHTGTPDLVYVIARKFFSDAKQHLTWIIYLCINELFTWSMYVYLTLCVLFFTFFLY